MKKKSLVIVESPGKIKTINKYLGDEYIVCSSKGHIRDLPDKPSKFSGKKSTVPREFAREIAAMGVDPDNNWQANYEILPGKSQVVEEICRLRKQCDQVFLATDLDREGEAIAWHLKEVLQGDESTFKRVVFNEITESAVRKAFANPSSINYDKVNAQQARRFLDRVVGFMLSPLLWVKVARGLSAGRVQSVAVRLVVEREREIRSFTPTPYWEVSVDLKIREKSISVDLVKQNGKELQILSEEQLEKIQLDLNQGQFKVHSIPEKQTKSFPGPPFITSTLQQMASSFLGFSSKRTMIVAQKLYEQGKITYMRTDSTAVSKEALDSCREYIQTKVGQSYLSETPRFYQRKKGTAQEAHEAIRPSDVFYTADSHMEKDESRLYELIWKRFVSSQMSDAVYKIRSVIVHNGSYELVTSLREVVFAGFTKIWGQQLDEKKSPVEQSILHVQQGDVGTLLKILPQKQYTRPKPRYTEASLTKELEKRNIGRPSTYVPILSTIQDRGYATLKNRRFYANQMGNIVTNKLLHSFTDLLNYDFTANMEEKLDLVASGELDWKDLLNDFYKKLVVNLRTAKNFMTKNAPIPVDVHCSLCAAAMEVRSISSGLFLSCTNYANKTCKATKSLVPWEEVAPDNLSNDADAQEKRDAELLLQKPRCVKCNLVVDEYYIDDSTKIFVCQDITDCGTVRVENGSYEIKTSQGPVIECDRCGQEMCLKVGRFGKYFACSQEICSNTRKIDSKGNVAPPKMIPIPCPELICQKVKDTYVLRDGTGGLFLAASSFPKNREIRQPFLDEILPHKHQIDSKYQYLFSAPTVDSQGRRTKLKFSKQKQIHHLISEENGKATNWKCEYDLEKQIWVESLSGKK